MAIRYLGAQDLIAELPPGAAYLRITIRDDRSLLRGRVKRVFPLSEPGGYLSVQDGDGKEVGVLRSLDGAEATTRQLIEAELDRRYFTPKIERVDALKMEAGMWRFAVVTQRGATEFYVRNWRDSAFEVKPGRWQIHSVDGGRFEIPNLEALDGRSQRLMEQLL